MPKGIQHKCLMAQTLTTPTKLHHPPHPELPRLQGIFHTVLIALHFNCLASTSTSPTRLGDFEKNPALFISNTP